MENAFPFKAKLSRVTTGNKCIEQSSGYLKLIHQLYEMKKAKNNKGEGKFVVLLLLQSARIVFQRNFNSKLFALCVLCEGGIVVVLE